MEEIKTGEYVRTKSGDIGIFQRYTEEGISQWFEMLSNGTLYTIPTIAIVKHRESITELLEKGDYINGHQIVNEIYGEDDNDLYFEIEGGYNQAKCIKENEIETILTKEQYERDCYKIN